MYKAVSYIFILGCLSLNLPAYGAQEVQESFSTVHSDWLVEGILEFPFYSFYLGAPAIRGVAYLPNFAPRLGPRVVYRDVGSTITFSLPIPAAERARRGDTTQMNFILNSYWRQNAYDAYYQRYRGFYVSSPFTELSLHKPSRYPQMPEAQVLNFGVNWYFAFSTDTYSFKAAYDQNEFQLNSGGSWVLNPFYNHLDMFLGTGFVLGSNPDELPKLPDLAAGRFDTFGLAAGYGYTFIRGHFFATGQAAYGPGLRTQRIQRSDGEHQSVLSLAAKLNLNAATGWNYSDYVGGMKVLVDSTWSKVADTQVSSSLVSLQFFFGRRF